MLGHRLVVLASASLPPEHSRSTLPTYQIEEKNSTQQPEPLALQLVRGEGPTLKTWLGELPIEWRLAVSAVPTAFFVRSLSLGHPFTGVGEHLEDTKGPSCLTGRAAS